MVTKSEEMKRALRRVRKRRRAGDQRVLDGQTPLAHHDLLVVPPAGVLSEGETFRVPVVKVKGQANQGEFDQSDDPVGNYVDLPEKLDLYDYAQRRTLTIARPQDWGDKSRRATSRGPAFGTLPVKREPAATSCAACYLIDAQNINFRNAWTAEEWSDFQTVDLPPAPSVDDDHFEVLLAGPRGMVFRLRVNVATDERPLWKPGVPVSIGVGQGRLEALDLRYEMEIWNQLRNGCVAGSALHHQSNQRIPLVNVTSLVEEKSARVAAE
jgi:hypothetical protein